MTKKKVRIVNEYRVLYLPYHKRAMSNDNWKGYVYEHIVVAEKYLGRSMTKNEVVHHLDGNRMNNSTTNLLIIDRGQHTKLHGWLNRGAPGIESFWENGMNSGKAKVTQPTFCAVCEKTLQEKQINCCSSECSKFDRRKVERPSKKELETGIKSMSMVKLGEKYGVSDNAVRKWAKTYGLLCQS